MPIQKTIETDLGIDVEYSNITNVNISINPNTGTTGIAVQLAGYPTLNAIASSKSPLQEYPYSKTLTSDEIANLQTTVFPALLQILLSATDSPLLGGSYVPQPELI